MESARPRAGEPNRLGRAPTKRSCVFCRQGGPDWFQLRVAKRSSRQRHSRGLLVAADRCHRHEPDGRILCWRSDQWISREKELCCLDELIRWNSFPSLPRSFSAVVGLRKLNSRSEVSDGREFDSADLSTANARCLRGFFLAVLAARRT